MKCLLAMKTTFVAVALLVVTAASQPTQARISIDALGGEVEIEGFLRSTARARLGAGTAHLGQWIQRFQLEASLNYTDVGVFDELSFVAIVRPEYDIVQDSGELSDGRIGEGSSTPSLASRAVFNQFNENLAFSGFENNFGAVFATSARNGTGGIGSLARHGFVSQAGLEQMFEVDFRRAVETGGNALFDPVTGGVNQIGGAFPQVVQKASNLNLRCNRCIDLNIDNRDVAMANTDSNGRLYPFRELYADAVIGDWWIRVGKQQIVWGKTDFFRLQDLVNPVDFGQHFFFDSFEDIRIPQWMASVQWKAGDFGPLTDNAIQFIWNFDEFQQIGLGNPSHFWGHPFAKDTSTFAIFNHYFSTEPCVAGAVAIANGMSTDSVCGSRGPNDQRLPSAFGTPSGLSANNRPEWELGNTEAGWRWEFRFSDFRFAVSHWYGWNDIPAFKFHTWNVNAGLLAGGNANPFVNDINVADLTLLDPACAGAGFGNDYVRCGRAGAAVGAFPVASVSPLVAAQLLQNSPIAAYSTAATNALNTGRFDLLSTGMDPAFEGLAIPGLGGACSPASSRVNLSCLGILGGQTSQEYARSHTLGLAMDYFEPWSGIVFRIESSWTFDELVNNTRTHDWLDKSEVMRFSIGMDRPTFIPFLNKDRTFFLSMQIFDTWYWDHEGDKNTGYFVDEHNWITTFFFL
ncbi:MAG: DUF1302 family protein, partial [Pseudomonadota bacterium]